MPKDIQVAQYFLSKDLNRTFFDKQLVQKNGRIFYQGNARLNKYLHMAQNLYIAKTGQKLFAEDLFADDNGAVAPNVQENYALLWARNDVPVLPADIRDFLDRIYKAFENASLDDMIELSHEDSEWASKHQNYAKPDQRMNSLAHAEEYREQYGDMLVVLDRMQI